MNEDIGETEKSMLYNEIHSMQNLNHANIVKYLECGQKEYIKPSGKRTVSFIALELAEAGELFDFISNTGRFSEKVTRHYFKQLCGAIKACHDSGIYHRDLKAENIFMDNKYELKVGDFGFSTTLMKADQKGLFKTLLGTPGYMAPEIVLQQKYVAAEVDLFAAGIVLFIMFTGHPPFG